MGETAPETVAEPMGAIEIQVVYYIEQVWNFVGKFPSVDKIKDKFPHFDLSSSLRKTAFINALQNRGIELPRATAGVNAHGDTELTNEQVAAVSAVLNFDDPRSRAAKLKDVGVSALKWQGWMKSEKFKSYLQALSANTFQDSLHVAHEGLIRAVDRGSTDAIKFYMELSGRHTDSSVEAQNLRIILPRLIEAIQRNVKDPELIRAIGNDFEKIMRGEVLAEPMQQIVGTI